MTILRVVTTTLAGCIFVVTLLSITEADAQQSLNNQKEETAQQEFTPEELFIYLASVKVVAPGVGFFNAEVGDPMSSLFITWGEPLEQRKKGVLGSVELLYRPDPNTLVTFTGKNTVKTISIKGNSASLLRTRRGARLGHTRSNIIRIYSRYESKARKNRIRYEKLGIDFFAEGDNINKIVVYSPKN